MHVVIAYGYEIGHSGIHEKRSVQFLAMELHACKIVFVVGFYSPYMLSFHTFYLAGPKKGKNLDNYN